MKLMSLVSRPINYGMTAADQTIKKIVTNPSAVRKVLKISTKLYAAFDLYTVGYTQKREITRVMNDTLDLMAFYSTYKNMMFWVNLFSKESLDMDTLNNSIRSSLCASHRNAKDIAEQKNIADNVFKAVKDQQSYHSKYDVQQIMKASLEQQGYSPLKAQEMAERVIVQQKSRPLVELLFMACDGIVDLTESIITLKKWSVLNLSQIAASMGNQSPVFKFVIKVGEDSVLGIIASVGLTLVVGNDFYKAIKQGLKYSHTSNSGDKELVYKELRNDLLDLLSNGTDLVAVATPMLISLNPATLIAMSLISKGTGLVCILIR